MNDVAQTVCGYVNVTLWRLEDTARSDPVFEIWAGRSLAVSLHQAICHGAAEFGFVRAGRMSGRRTTSLAERWYAASMMCLVYSLSISDRYSISTVLEPIRQGAASLRFEHRVPHRRVAGSLLCRLRLSALVADRPPQPPQHHRYLPHRLVRVDGGHRALAQLLAAPLGADRRRCRRGRRHARRQLHPVGFLSGVAPRHGVVGLLPRRPDRRLARLAGRPARSLTGSAGARCSSPSEYREFWLGCSSCCSLREPRRGCLDECEDRGKSPSFVETMRFLLRQRSTMHSIVAQSLTALWGWGLMWWTPAFLMRSYSLNVAQAGGILGRTSDRGERGDGR